jgi:hypothetical protein
MMNQNSDLQQHIQSSSVNEMQSHGRVAEPPKDQDSSTDPGPELGEVSIAPKLLHELNGSLVLRPRNNSRAFVTTANNSDASRHMPRPAPNPPRLDAQLPDVSDLRITPEQLQEIIGMFDEWDSDGSGSISLPELKDRMGASGFSVSELESIFKEFDEDGNGELDKVEFVGAIASACYSITEQALQQVLPVTTPAGLKFNECMIAL